MKYALVTVWYIQAVRYSGQYSQSTAEQRPLKEYKRRRVVTWRISQSRHDSQHSSTQADGSSLNIDETGMAACGRSASAVKGLCAAKV